MIPVDVIIAKRVDKLARIQLTNMGHQMHQQGIRSDVEWHYEKSIRRPLIELTMKDVTVFNFELKQRVAGWQIYVVSLVRIPTCHNQSSRIGICLNVIYEIGNLVSTVSFRIVAPKRPPEITINRPQLARLASKPSLAFFIGPLGPHVYSFRT